MHFLSAYLFYNINTNKCLYYLNRLFTAGRQRRFKMCGKKLLKFYFRAQRLNYALDDLIAAVACKSSQGDWGGEYYAERLITIIQKKALLGQLWRYLHGVLSSFCRRDLLILKSYALSQGGYSGLPREQANGIRRVVVRFMRRARLLDRYAKATELVSQYYSLLGR